MNTPPLICRPVLEELAQRYERRKAGRTGTGVQRILFDYEEILKACGCADGSERVAAEEQLREAAQKGWIILHTLRRDSSIIDQIEFPPSGEAPLFAAIRRAAPSHLREQWAQLFRNAVEQPVMEPWRDLWRDWCLSLAESASQGKMQPPFRWDDVAGGDELLQVASRALERKWESLIRFASCLICGDSKRLKEIKPRVEAILASVTRGAAGTLEAHGILEVPRSILVHGPLRLEFPDGSIDFGLLQAPVRISETDILRATAVHTAATRCLTIENETTMQELAKQQSGTLLIHTSFASSALLALASRLPAEADCWHFGDTDPAGFAILADLRRRTGRPFKPLHMQFRPDLDGLPLTAEDQSALTRLLSEPLLADVHPELERMQLLGRTGCYEQESLGFPGPEWPFYPEQAGISAESRAANRTPAHRESH